MRTKRLFIRKGNCKPHTSRRNHTYLVRDLDDDRTFGWDEIWFAPESGYYLSGPFGKMQDVEPELGRLYMRGLAVPI
jgi:hypothetical protein